MKEISIVIPVYNSMDNINELYRQIEDALKNISFELIFVNDYSRDNSWEIIKQLAKENKNVTGINFRKNFGQDNALIAGFHYATGRYVVIMDDDIQHSPYDIIKMYNACNDKFDVCYAKFDVKKQKPWKNFGSWLNGIFAKLLFQKPNGIYMSPFKIVKIEIIKELLKYSGPFPYVDGLILEITNNLTSIDTDHHQRYKGRSNYNFIKSLLVFLKTLTGFSILPLRFVTFMGIITSTLGFLGAIYYLFEYFFLINKTVEGWTSTIISLLIIGGLILLSLGLIGEYLGRMFLTVNKKPQYSIDEIIKEGKDANVKDEV